jgi:hypothetical protein
MEEWPMARWYVIATTGVVMVGAALAIGCARRAPGVAAYPAVPGASPAVPAASPATSAPAPPGLGLRAATVEYLPASAGAPAGLPPNAAPGECFAQAIVPAKVETVTERVVKKPASTRVSVVPPEFQDVEERVMVRPATTQLETVPAVVRTVTEQVLVRPAYQVWKRSSQLTPAERAQQPPMNPAAGDILCLVEVPAEFRTVTREVVDQPAGTRQVEVPAEYRTVTVKKMVTPAREVKTEVPAEYEEVAKQVVRVPASTEWRAVLCDTNASPQTLAALQASLKRAGFDPGRADGRVDDRTLNAVREFQRAKGLPMDNDRYINMATVKALGVAP